MIYYLFRQAYWFCIVLINEFVFLELKMKEITKFYKRFVFSFKNKINLDIENLNNKSLNELFNHFGTDKGTEVLNPYSKESNAIQSKEVQMTSTKKCDRCRGTGRVNDDLSGVAIFGGPIPIFTKICPDCKGRGVVSEKKK